MGTRVEDFEFYPTPCCCGWWGESPMVAYLIVIYDTTSLSHRYCKICDIVCQVLCINYWTFLSCQGLLDSWIFTTLMRISAFNVSYILHFDSYLSFISQVISLLIHDVSKSIGLSICELFRIMLIVVLIVQILACF